MPSRRSSEHPEKRGPRLRQRSRLSVGAPLPAREPLALQAGRLWGDARLAVPLLGELGAVASEEEGSHPSEAIPREARRSGRMQRHGQAESCRSDCAPLPPRRLSCFPWPTFTTPDNPTQKGTWRLSCVGTALDLPLDKSVLPTRQLPRSAITVSRDKHPGFHFPDHCHQSSSAQLPNAP